MSAGFRGGPGLGWILGRMRLDGGIVARSLPVFAIKQTWANATQAFRLLQVFLKDNGSLNTSLLLEVLRNGSPLITVLSNGEVRLWNNGFQQWLSLSGAGGSPALGNSGVGCLVLNNDGGIRVNGSITIGSQNDTIILRDAAHKVAQRNGTNGQAFRIYRTFTSANNYERVGLNLSDNTFMFGPEAAGAGTLRPLYISTGAVPVASLAPAATVGAGTICHVTDASSAMLRSIAVGGGSNFCQVMSDGTNWLISA